MMSMKPSNHCEIYVPWVSGSGPKAGPILPYSENELNLKSSTEWMVMMPMDPST